MDWRQPLFDLESQDVYVCIVVYTSVAETDIIIAKSSGIVGEISVYLSGDEKRGLS